MPQQQPRPKQRTGRKHANGALAPSADDRKQSRSGEKPFRPIKTRRIFEEICDAIRAKLISGEIKGTEGETFTVPNLNDGKPYTIGDKSVVILGPPFVFNKDNVNNFDF